MADARTKFIDFYAHRQPKTDRWCCMCQRDLKPGQPHRHVYVDPDMHAVHPEDLNDRVPLADDIGWSLIGVDCANKHLGVEWTTETRPES